MSTNSQNNVRLGIFVTIGVLILVVSLYIIGKNQNFFGSSYSLRARFRNVSGLMVGNNIRYSGIQSGTVSKIAVIDDTTIEVTMLVDVKMRPYIHQGASASIGSEGLMGNKVINITPGNAQLPLLAEGEMLLTKKVASTDEMLETLSSTNNDVQVIAENLKNTVIKLNNSTALWQVVNDSTLPGNIRLSMDNIRQATEQINEFSAAINEMVKEAEKGEGVAGTLLKDEAAATDLKNAIRNISRISEDAKLLIAHTDSAVKQLDHNVNNGPGAAHAVLKDTGIVKKLTTSLGNIEKGTAAFSENMEALKHNFLTRGYFKKQAKKQKKATQGK